MNLKEIVDVLSAEIIIPKEKKNVNLDKIEIKGINSLKYADENEISFLNHKIYLHDYETTKSQVICVEKKFFRDELIRDKILLIVDNCKDAIYVLSKKFYQETEIVPYIHKTAIIEHDVILGKDVYIGEYCVIKSGSVIGEKTVINAFCYIGKNVTIGTKCVLFPSVKILDRVKIGNNVIIQSGSVIGSDGFGYIYKDGKYTKISQMGIVEIADDVEIGANVTIDRATLGKTVIGEGTKIDNLVHIAHNVEIGKNCLIIAQAGIAGSAKIKNNVILAGQAGITDHVIIEDNVIVAAQAGVISNIPSGKIVSGFPAREHKLTMKINAILNKLPELYEKIKKFK